MKITSTILSIPPYLSTPWKNISTLHVRERGGKTYTLIVLLQNGARSKSPTSPRGSRSIFDAHAKYAATENTPASPFDAPFSFNLPLKKWRHARRSSTTSCSTTPSNPISTNAARSAKKNHRRSPKRLASTKRLSSQSRTPLQLRLLPNRPRLSRRREFEESK